MKAKVLLGYTLVMSLDGRYEAHIKVLAVERTLKFPLGVKARFVLLDVKNNVAKFLIDNHEPYGFHMHTRLPNDPDQREKIDTDDYIEALRMFFRIAEGLVSNEKS